MPQTWQMAYVSLIFNNRDRSNAENFRTISVTSIVYTLMESFVKELMMSHIRVANLLLTKKYGFINGQSIATQLLSYFD